MRKEIKQYQERLWMRCGKSSQMRKADDTSKSFLPVHAIACTLAEIWTREDANERLKTIKDEYDRQAIEECIEIKDDAYTIETNLISYKDVVTICGDDYVAATSIWNDMYKHLPTIDRFSMQG
jgi:hypothetical protein